MSLNMPMEPTEPFDLDMSGAIWTGGAVVLGAFVETETGPAPALVFRFPHPDGSGFYQPVVLLASERELLDLAKLVRDGAKYAAEAARKAGGES